MKKNLLNPLSTAINAYLHLDPESKNRLKRLKDKVVTIELKPFGFIFQCAFDDTGVSLHQGEDLPAETHIAGTPMQLMAMSIFKSDRQRFFADDVAMTGSAELGYEVIALFDEMDIDWEEYLSHLIGDETSHRAGNLARGIKSWIKHADRTFTANINEYVHEEAEWLPTHEALQDLFNDIDDFRMDVDRISAKIDKIKRPLNKETQ